MNIFNTAMHKPKIQFYSWKRLGRLRV